MFKLVALPQSIPYILARLKARDKLYFITVTVGTSTLCYFIMCVTLIFHLFFVILFFLCDTIWLLVVVRVFYIRDEQG